MVSFSVLEERCQTYVIWFSALVMSGKREAHVGTAESNLWRVRAEILLFSQTLTLYLSGMSAPEAEWFPLLLLLKLRRRCCGPSFMFVESCDVLLLQKENWLSSSARHSATHTNFTKLRGKTDRMKYHVYKLVNKVVNCWPCDWPLRTVSSVKYLARQPHASLSCRRWYLLVELWVFVFLIWLIYSWVLLTALE